MPYRMRHLCLFLLPGLFSLPAQPLIAASLPALPRPAPSYQGKVFYFAMTDRFWDGDTTNNYGGLSAAVGRNSHGYDPTEAKFYHGGDLAGIVQKLDYLQGLGIDALWLTPVLKNRTTQGLGNDATAGFHGYWIVDFLKVDPHLGSNEEYTSMIATLQERGIDVYMDIVINHTADVITTSSSNFNFVYKSTTPYKDASGNPFNDRDYVYNGYNQVVFPTLSAFTSFPKSPQLFGSDSNSKNPAWLNDPIYYHNRGNSTFQGENSLYGDFFGLDDLFTENPAVVQGLIDIFSSWIQSHNLAGFRIDTMKHVNQEFWQAFCPAIRKTAREAGRPDFFQFGESWSGDVGFLSDYPTLHAADASLDFGLAYAIQDFLFGRKSAFDLQGFYEADDLYLDHDTTGYEQPTFVSNHDIGRLGGMLSGSAAEKLDTMELAYGMLFFGRGQPVIYYGDEQGFVGQGDPGAREDMLPSQTVAYKDTPLIGTTLRPRDANFDTAHPLYAMLSRMALLRKNHPALVHGSMVIRPATNDLLAYSRIQSRSDSPLSGIEYLVFFNRSKSSTQNTSVATYQASGGSFSNLFDSRGNPSYGNLTVDAAGKVNITIPPLQFAVFLANQPLPSRNQAPTVTFAKPAANSTVTLGSREVDGNSVRDRAEIRVTLSETVSAEVTFGCTRSTKPGLYFLGVDDHPPYRIFFLPPSDAQPNESFTFHATVRDASGHTATATLENVKFNQTSLPFLKALPPPPAFLKLPEPRSIVAGQPLFLEAALSETDLGGSLFQWLKDDLPLPGANSAQLQIATAASADSGNYRVLAWNSRGALLSDPVEVTVKDACPSIFVEPYYADLGNGWKFSWSSGFLYEAYCPFAFHADNGKWYYVFPGGSAESSFGYDFNTGKYLWFTAGYIVTL